MGGISFLNRSFDENFEQLPPSALLAISSPEPGSISFSAPTWSVLDRFEGLLSGQKAPLDSQHFLRDDDPTFQKAVEGDSKAKLYTLEPELRKTLDKHNADRATKGLPPVDFEKTQKRIEDIMNDPSLSDQQKKDKIEAIRKETGLSKNNMKKLFTKRMAKIFGEAAKQMETRLNRLKDLATEAERLYGKNSTQAAQARERLEAAESALKPALKDYRQKSTVLNSLFPGFWSRLGGFFKSLGKGLLKVGRVFTKVMNFVSPFLRFIPGIGQMISFGWSALKGLVSLARGNWRGCLGSFLSFAKIITPVGDLFHKTAGYLRQLISPLRQGISQGS